MFKKATLILCALFLCVSLCPADMTGNGGEDEAAYALLDKLVLAFRTMAEKGTGGKDVVNNALNEIMATARTAKEQGQLDPVFSRRFRRILITLRLAIVEDKEGILEPLIKREIGDFVLDIYGELGVPIDKKGEPAIGIGRIAGAVAEEILNLQIYLDTKEEKAKLMEEHKKKLLLDKKKKK